jgi:hypothetical protein
VCFEAEFRDEICKKLIKNTFRRIKGLLDVSMGEEEVLYCK